MEIDILIELMNELCVEIDQKFILIFFKELNCILDLKCSLVNELCEEIYQRFILKFFKELDGFLDLKCSFENEFCEESYYQRFILKFFKDLNGILDLRCYFEIQKDFGCFDDLLLLIMKYIVGIYYVMFSLKVIVELSKENKEVKFIFYYSEEFNNLLNVSNSVDDEVVSFINLILYMVLIEYSSVMESIKREKRDDGLLLDFFLSIDFEVNMVFEEINIFVNVLWVMDMMEIGYIYIYKIVCVLSMNQIFVCGNNKIIKQMNLEGKFVEKVIIEFGNQFFDLVLISDVQLMYSDYNGKCVNVVRNNGKIENLIKFQKWFLMVFCMMVVNDLLVIMEFEDLVMCKVVCYLGFKVK